jgi:hypothetical protein
MVCPGGAGTALQHDEALNRRGTPEQTIRFTGEDGLGARATQPIRS